MLDRFFRVGRVRERLRAGALGFVVDVFAARLHERSRSPQIIRKYVRAVGHFSHWLNAEGIAVGSWDEDTVHSFVGEHFAHCRCPVPKGEPPSLTGTAVRHLLDLLRERGDAPSARPRPIDARRRWSDEVLARFETHLRDICGMADESCSYYCSAVRSFLQAKYDTGIGDLSLLVPSDIVCYISNYAARVSPGTARQTATILRAFLRSLQLQGLCDARLVASVPSIPYWKLASVPKLLTDDQLRLLLGAFDRSTDVGRRDYAIALCLSRLGMRSCEVARLHLDDIDWRRGTVRIKGGKRRRAHVLPLPADLGRAIVAYLKHGRPHGTQLALFLRRRPPHEAMRGDDIQAMIRNAHRRGRVGSPWKGTHVLRHTTATRMLRGGVSLKHIADILGHKSIDTTTIYAKVDLERLAAVALPWPEVRP